jgi:hypothetical protein
VPGTIGFEIRWRSSPAPTAVSVGRWQVCTRGSRSGPELSSGRGGRRPRDRKLGQRCDGKYTRSRRYRQETLLRKACAARDQQIRTPGSW